MKKSFFTAALACALAFGGTALVAQDSLFSFNNETGALSVNGASEVLNIVNKNSGKLSLKECLASRGKDGASFGYLLVRNGSKEFVSLSSLIDSIKTNGDTESVSLGSFNRDDTVQFGYAAADGSGFSGVSIASDAGFYTGMDTDSFFKLDFSENPFDGEIEVILTGEPLPPSTVTLLIALAAGAGFIFLNNRKKQARCAEQA